MLPKAPAAPQSTGDNIRRYSMAAKAQVSKHPNAFLGLFVFFLLAAIGMAVPLAIYVIKYNNLNAKNKTRRFPPPMGPPKNPSSKPITVAVKDASENMAAEPITAATIRDMIASGKPGTVMVYSNNCGACHSLRTKLTHAKAAGTVLDSDVALMPVSELGSLRDVVNVTGVPYLFRIQDGKVTKTLIGDVPEADLVAFLKQ